MPKITLGSCRDEKRSKSILRVRRTKRVVIQTSDATITLLTSYMTSMYLNKTPEEPDATPEDPYNFAEYDAKRLWI